MFLYVREIVRMLDFCSLRRVQKLAKHENFQIYGMLLVSFLHSSAYLGFHGAAPIHYVQAAILNILPPHLRSTTILLDT